MSVVSTDLKIYLAANHAEADTGTQGGAIDPNARVLDDQFTAAAVVEFDSDAAGDTQIATITGRLADGTIDTEAVTLTGTTAKAGAKSFERILKISLASVAIGNITVAQGAGGTVRHTFAVGEDLTRSLFYGSVANAVGGGDAVRYEKVFAKNTNATSALLTATVELTTDPRADYDLILEDAIDDTNTSTNRVTLPSGNTGSYGDGPHSVPGTDLGAGEAIGVWIRQTLAEGTSPTTDEPEIEIAGSTA